MMSHSNNIPTAEKLDAVKQELGRGRSIKKLSQSESLYEQSLLEELHSSKLNYAQRCIIFSKLEKLGLD